MMLKKRTSQKVPPAQVARTSFGRPSSYKPEYAKMAKYDHHGHRDPNGGNEGCAYIASIPVNDFGVPPRAYASQFQA
jgi:hypothetical protein